MNDERIYQITVVSGKGGTGKTSIIAALAYLFKDFTVLADADVDAADLYLIFEPQETKSTDFYGLKKAVIDQKKCSRCNLCRESGKWRNSIFRYSQCFLCYRSDAAGKYNNFTNT